MDAERTALLPGWVLLKIRSASSGLLAGSPNPPHMRITLGFFVGGHWRAARADNE